MREQKFLKRLKKELPVWVERGWVPAESRRPILDHVASQGGGVRYLPFAFSILGVLLLGSGVITYFAANWAAMPKLIKLMILFGALWSAYGSSLYFLQVRNAPSVGKALLSLGVILFGANIMLISQIYHIDAHAPNGVLMWSLGGLLVAYLTRSQGALIAGVLLAVLWTGMETFGFDRTVHWPFLILWMLFLPPVYTEKWRPAWRVILIGLFLWSFFIFVHANWLIIRGEWPKGTTIHLIQIYFLAYLGLFILGMAMETYEGLVSFSPLPQRYGMIASLASFYLLTFPKIDGGTRLWLWVVDEYPGRIAPMLWVVLTLMAMVCVIGLAIWTRGRPNPASRPADLKWGEVPLVLLIGSLTLNLFVTEAQSGAVAVVFNLLFFSGLVWLIYVGLQNNNLFLVNVAFFFFGLGLLSRYFDTFWTLMNRSFFFMVGGLLLLGGGYFLDRQRRKLTARIIERVEGGPA